MSKAIKRRWNKETLRVLNALDSVESEGEESVLVGYSEDRGLVLISNSDLVSITEWVNPSTFDSMGYTVKINCEGTKDKFDVLELLFIKVKP